MNDAVDQMHSASSDKRGRLSNLDYFLLMFPLKQLTIMMQLISVLLQENGKKETTMGELLNFFAVMILGTRYKFTSRVSFWSTTSSSNYNAPEAFGKTGMPQTRFEDI